MYIKKFERQSVSLTRDELAAARRGRIGPGRGNEPKNGMRLIKIAAVSIAATAPLAYYNIERKTERKIQTINACSTRPAHSKELYENILVSLRKNDLPKPKGFDFSYAKKINGEAEYASKMLHIPKRFVLAQWFMESGIPAGLGSKNISYNNLANLGYETDGGAGFHLDKYYTLRDFTISYVQTLLKEGVYGMKDEQKIISTMKQGGFFTASTESYTKALKAVERLIPAQREASACDDKGGRT